MLSKEQILDEIRRCAADNDGVPIGRTRFAALTGIRESDWSGRYWRNWSVALEEAGYSPNSLNTIRQSDQQLIRTLAELTVELGHFPTKADRKLKRLTDPSFPSANVFDRLGNRDDILRQLVNCAASDEALAAVVEICQPQIRSDAHTSLADDETNGATGFVYLIRMDKWHKIGVTNDILRRTGELRITLPTRETLVHTIETDDPFGVEKYWHNRFKDRRANGEWFLLTPVDVKAFKKWRRIH